MKLERNIKEALALELTKIKIVNESKDSTIDAPLLIATYSESLKEIDDALKAQKKAMKISPKVIQSIK